MLYKLESNSLYLEGLLKRCINEKEPSLLAAIEEWLDLIQMLPISEKIMCMAEVTEPLLEGLASQSEKEEWEEVKKALIQENKLKDVQVIEVFEQTLDQWIHLSRKKGGVSVES